MEIEIGYNEVVTLLCDFEGCPHQAIHPVLWKLDEDDDDGTVGWLCALHVEEVLGRGHAMMIVPTCDEADEAVWDPWDCDDVELLDTLEEWGDALWRDIEREVQHGTPS